MNLKIIHIVHWKNSGIYSVARDLSIEGEKLGHKHFIRLIRKKKGTLDSAFSIFRILFLIFEIVFKPNTTYHVHSFLPFLFIIFIRGQKAVTFHNLYPYFSSKSKKDHIKRWIIKKLVSRDKTAISSVGAGVASALELHMGISSKVIFNGLRYNDYFFSKSTNRMTIGAAGRLDDQKNFENLILAFAHLDYPINLVIAGEGVKRQLLENLILAHNLEKRVKLVGHQSDMNSFYRSIDAFICCSLYEGFGLVIAEAICSGKLIISSNVGIAMDFPDMKFIRCGTSAESICSALKEWIALPVAEIEKFTQYNREEIIANLSISKVYNQYVDFLWIKI